MKANKIIYWTTTILMALQFILASSMYLTKNPELVKSFTDILHLPIWFMMLLGVAKLLGGIGLLIPQKFGKLNEWVYAGLTFILIGAIWAHIETKTPFIMPAISLVILAVSYFFRNKAYPVSVNS